MWPVAIFILVCCSCADQAIAEVFLAENESDRVSLGCYGDTTSQRDLPELRKAPQLASRRYCLGYCRTRGYLYFGLQDGVWCTCGNSYGRHGRLRSQECRVRCAGNRSETCGASLKNEIFTTGIEKLSGNLTEPLGCFADSDQSKDLPLKHRAGRLTAQHFCRNYCKTRSYRYFGLQNSEWCVCGNSYGRYGQVSEEFCNHTCPEDPDRMCGGLNNNLVFATGVQDWETKGHRIGCFTDKASRDLPLVLSASQLASRQYCWHQCASRGYGYFGLQAGRYCTCGDAYGKYGKITDENCNLKCTGERNETCGAGMINEVFSTGQLDWTANVSHLGCFVDAVVRDLPMVHNMADGANRFECWSFCHQRGYKYFGLQTGKLCLCGNQFGRHGPASAASECGTACSGDSSRMCGGSWRSDIYATGIEVAAENAISRIGCYQDGSVRDLPLRYEAGAVTTRLVCWHFCKLRGYRNFGLQGGRYCTCGNGYGRHGAAPDSHCSNRCAGDDRETCGNSYKNEIFSTGVSSDWETGVIRMGCFVEGPDRDLPAMLSAGHLTSRYHCWNYCRSNGYKYFGLQAAVWCACGNAYGSNGQVKDAECSQQCKGDSSTTCGGQTQSEVFTTGIEPWDTNVTRLGCFKGGSEPRDLQLVHRTGASTRRQHCWQFCQSRGYRYFGLQSGDRCACGNSYAGQVRVNDSECRVRCRGFTKETCGGQNRTEMFTTGLWDWDSDIISLGCFEDRSSRDFTKFYKAGKNTNKYFCWNYCRSRGYQYFGLQAASWCTCGNVFSRFHRRNRSECSMSCEGDPSTTCGGSMRNVIFTTGINQWERKVKSLGCFNDSQANRTAPVEHQASEFSASKHYCWLYCRSRSYSYFAMRSRVICLCGNWYDRYGLVRKEKCDEDCMGDARVSCTGLPSDTIELFNTGIESWEKSTSRLGCFLDNEDSRDFPVKLDAVNKLTKRFCWSFCHARGHKYFALQARRFCYCGSAYGRHGKADDAQCSDRCRGDSSTTCGGELRNEVFTTGLGDWGRHLTRHGCFADGPDPDLPFKHNMGGLATRHTCWKLCSTRGYRYFGLQNKQMCHCGNSFGRYGSDLGAGGCREPCSGDSSSTCGGVEHTEVFSTGVQDWDNGTAAAMGCFIDKPDEPDLDSGLQHLGEAATRRSCLTRCRALGRRYFALQASQWCSCGDAFGRHGRAESSSDCNLPCLGDPGDTCGGHLRNEVFSTGL